MPALLQQAAGDRAVTRVFHDQGIPIEVLNNGDAFVPTRDLCGLFERAARAAADRCLGLRVGARISVTEFGRVSGYVAQAPTLGNAIVRAAKVIRFKESDVEIQLQPRGDLVATCYRSAVRGVVGSRHYSDLKLGINFDVATRYTGASWRPAWIELDYPKGPYASAIEDHYQVPVLFDRPMVAIVFDRHYLSSRRLENQEFRNYLKFSELRQMVSSGPPKTFADSVREIVRLRMLGGETGIDGAADRLRLGNRTVQRRLQEDGLSYRELVEQVRIERAYALLGETRESITDIALELGYASPAHFSRAFMRWTGHAPSKARSIRTADTE